MNTKSLIGLYFYYFSDGNTVIQNIYNGIFTTIMVSLDKSFWNGLYPNILARENVTYSPNTSVDHGGTAQTNNMLFTSVQTPVSIVFISCYVYQ